MTDALGGLGHRFDPLGHQVTKFRVLAAAGAGETPDEVDLSPFAPPVLDQGSTSACTMHAIGGAAVTSCAKAGTPLPFFPSPDLGYKLGRCIDRDWPEDQADPPPLVDVGAMPNQVIRACAEWGVAPMGPFVEGRLSDAAVATINDEPKLGALEVADGVHLPGAYRIDSVGAQRVLDVRKALAAGFAVCFAFLVDHATDEYRESRGGTDTPLTASDPMTVRGSHYVYAYGYRTENGGTIFKFRNSWSKEWGKAGDGEGDEAFVAGWSDIYVMAVKPTPKQEAA